MDATYVTICTVTTTATMYDTSSSWPADLKWLEDEDYKRCEKCTRKERGANWTCNYRQDVCDFDKSYVQGCCLERRGGQETWSLFPTERGNHGEILDYQRGTPSYSCLITADYRSMGDFRPDWNHRKVEKTSCDHFCSIKLWYCQFTWPASDAQVLLISASYGI